MKNYLKTGLLLISLLSLLGCSLYSQSFDRKVFASQGGKTIGGAYYFSFTIGEPIIGTDDNALPILTKGFEQPIDPSVLDIIHRRQLIDEADLQYKIYPNPVQKTVNFSYNSQTDGLKKVSLLNALGQVVFSQTYEKEDLIEGAHIDMTELPAGSYWLLCSDLGKRSVFPLRKE